MNQYRGAIVDYSKAIERRLANEVFLLSLKRFRAKYDNVSDEVLCRKLNVLFFPAMKYDDFAKRLSGGVATFRSYCPLDPSLRKASRIRSSSNSSELWNHRIFSRINSIYKTYAGKFREVDHQNRLPEEAQRRLSVML